MVAAAVATLRVQVQLISCKFLLINDCFCFYTELSIVADMYNPVTISFTDLILDRISFCQETGCF